MTSKANVSQPRLTLVPPPVPPASVERRHRWIFASFVAAVGGPLLVVGAYLYFFAADQYTSHVGFSVRADSTAAPMELFGGLAEVTGSGTQDAAVLTAFIQSQEIVERIEAKLQLSERFSVVDGDPIFVLNRNGTTEDLHAFWERMVQVTQDTSTGLLEVDVRAFSPLDAQDIAVAILAESALLVQRLSKVAQADTTSFARDELSRAENRMREARIKLTEFRSRSQIVDPNVDLHGRMGLLATLQQELAAALIEADILRTTTRSSDIRLNQADARISVIEARIDEERLKIGAGGTSSIQDYANIVSNFERLTADRAFAEQSYTLALSAYDAALAEARRKSKHLAVHISPSLAQSPEYPRKLTLFALSGFFLIATWSALVLIFYSLRDRR